MDETLQNILKAITDCYLNSRQFNGPSLNNIAESFNLDEFLLKRELSSLIREKMISLNFGDRHPNPHIKAFWEEDEQTQIEKLQKLEKSRFPYVCVYPSGSHLKEVVNPLTYKDRPFTYRLALGEPQLSFVSFDLSVLEFYRNDPRYTYENGDIQGWISVSDEYYESGKMAESDKTILRDFGFCHDSQFNRAVAVFLRYLAELSPQHQQIWNAKILEDNYKLHPMYYKTAIIGDWADGLPIFKAFSEELHHINEMCKLMERPPLFKEELRREKRPRGLSFLTRPTRKEFNDFVHLLDKALSENINRNFFLNEVAYEYEETRSDGKLVVRNKGTIQILDEWLRHKMRMVDWSPIDEMIKTFKQVRRLRQRPAHKIEEDEFDQKYFKLQRKLIQKVYNAVRILRLSFANHPNVEGYEIPDYLQDGPIWDF